MKIIIAGGTGQIGSILARAFHKDNHEITVLSRKPARELWQTIVWDAETLGDWTAEIDDSDVVINLAGRTVNCRYNEKNRRAKSLIRALTRRRLLAKPFQKLGALRKSGCR